MAYLTAQELSARGFAKLGRNVKISADARIYNPEQTEIGDNSRIDDFCVLNGRVRIGRNVHVTVFNNIAGGIPGITIGDFSTLAYGCNLFAQSDDYSGVTMANSTVPKQYKAERFEAVAIGDHCILGSRVSVAPGVVIGEGVAVGAHSLVMHSLAPWGVYYGTPARFQKPRDKGCLVLHKQMIDQEALRSLSTKLA